MEDAGTQIGGLAEHAARGDGGQGAIPKLVAGVHPPRLNGKALGSLIAKV
jgi:hypothetical protein